LNFHPNTKVIQKEAKGIERKRERKNREHHKQTKMENTLLKKKGKIKRGSAKLKK
jgi:hypothetical protein